MAVLTDIGGLYVGRMFTGRGGAVVTAGTVIRHIGVIKVRRYPGIRSMALTAIRLCRDMATMFSGGDGSIVTTAAATNHIGVIHPNDRHP